MLRGALLVAVFLGVAFGGRSLHRSPSRRPEHESATTAQVARLDGRLPDGAPSGATGNMAADVADPPDGHLAQTLALAIETPTPSPLPATPAPPPAVSTAVRAAPSTPVPFVAPVPTTAPAPAATSMPPNPAPGRYASAEDLQAALAQTAWPSEVWGHVIAIAFCESGVDVDRDGVYDLVDTQAIGGGGRYIGVLQIGVGHVFSQPYDLRTLAGNLAAGYELWAGAGGSFAPWGCR